MLAVLFAMGEGAAFAGPVPRRAKAPEFARSCAITPPDLGPIWSTAIPDSTAKAGSDDDEADDGPDDGEDDEDEGEGEDSVPGLIVPGSDTCLAISGTVTAGLQFDSYRVPKAGDAAPRPAFSWPTTANLRIATSQTLPSGLWIGTAFEVSTAPAAGQPDSATIEEATVAVGPMLFGLAGSRFSFWTGEDFAFSARSPGRNVGLIAWERDLTERWTLALAAEDPTAATTTSIPLSRGRVPDGVARLLYTQGDLTLHLAGALRDVPGGTARLGRAGILGATYKLKAFGGSGEITAQIAAAVDAAAYIGSSLDTTIVRQVLTPADSSRGFSTVVAAKREWTDTLASNLYVSRYQIAVPLADASRAKLRIDRLSTNLVWSPVEGFRAGIEGSLAYTEAAFRSRAIPATIGGRLLSAQLFIERAF
ncbi:hypothetical protein [Bosea sp. (in: a-proteobacteria)]|uniref:hypothetical protein n=1 Tax=Bosea sp. (in: a-proteobacteria) TaxID=1871050 RepID=UPI003B3A552B